MSKLFSDYEEDFKKAFRLAAREPSNHASTNLQPIRDAFREGFSLQEQSKWTEAVKVFEECIENHEKVLGRDHELMVGARNYLARCYVEIGRYSDALSLWTICENISMKSLGPTNPITLQFTSSLCAVLIDLGKWSEAKEKEEAFLHTLEKIQEPDSFRVLGVVVQLGMIYINLGQYDLAIAYHERALSGLQKTMGFNNIETIHAQFKLGAVYAEMGDMHKAANIYEQNRDVCASTRGITNEVYLRSAVNLGSVQRLGGNDIEAEKTLRSLLPVTGPDRKHRYWQKYIGRAADELMKVYMNSGRHDDVRRVQAWVQGDAKALLEIRAFEADQNNTPTWSPRVGDEDEVFNWTIQIVSGKGDLEFAAALSDTGCQTGNWISRQLVERLGKSTSVSQEFDSPGVSDANGRPVTAAGIIELQWKRHPRGTKFYHGRFYVFANIDRFDILIGAEYMVKQALVSIPEDALVPLITHKKLSKNDKAVIALAKEKQRQDKEALELRRQGGTSQQSDSQAQQPQNQQQQQTQ